MKSWINRRNFMSALGLSAASAVVKPAMASAENTVQFKSEYAGVKITNVTTYKIPRAIFIKLDTNVGISGWGEASPNSTPVIEALIHHWLKKNIMGKDPFNIEPIWDHLFWEGHDLGPGGALPYAIAGLDLALWDIKGKLLNLPVYKLLGGSYRKEMLAYGGIPISGGRVPIENAVRRALKLADNGFKVIKLRMQIREYNLNPVPDPTLTYYSAVRKALPDDIELFVDPNEGYTASRAIQIGKALEEMGMKYYESPCPLENHRDTAEVVKAIDIPLMAGEKCYTRWQFRDLILHGNPDIIQPDVIKAGGITEVKKIATLGQAFFKLVAPHNTKPTLGTAAALHVLASISNAGPFIEFIETHRYKEVLSVVEAPVTFRDGKLVVPESPGLGLIVNEKRLHELAK